MSRDQFWPGLERGACCTLHGEPHSLVSLLKSLRNILESMRATKREADIYRGPHREPRTGYCDVTCDLCMLNLHEQYPRSASETGMKWGSKCHAVSPIGPSASGERLNLMTFYSFGRDGVPTMSVTFKLHHTRGSWVSIWCVRGGLPLSSSPAPQSPLQQRSPTTGLY